MVKLVNMALTKKDLLAIGSLLDQKLDEKLKELERRLDNHSERLEKLENIHPRGKHLPQIRN